MGKSKKSQFVRHGTMSLMFGEWRAHQGSQAQLAPSMRRQVAGRPLEGQAAGRVVGSERSAASG